MLIKWILLILFLSSGEAHSEVKVAFLISYDDQGRPLQLVPDGQFSHLAISYQDQWLHIHPLRGGELTEDLSELSDSMVILESKDFNEPNNSFVQSYVGLPHDIRDSWDSNATSYCSKPAARLFGIPPKERMTFETPGWKSIASLPRGKKGLAPDDIFQALINMGFTIQPMSCKSMLQSNTFPNILPGHEILRAKARLVGR